MRRLISLLSCALATCAMVVPAFAVTTSHWVQKSEADFKPGHMHNTVATNLGEVKLSRSIKTLLEQDPKVTSVYSLAEAPDGTIYAGTGPQGLLLQIKDGKVSTAATIDGGVNIFSLLIDDKGGLLLGTGGDKGRIFRIDRPGDKPRQIFAADGVQYIWAIRQTPDGNLYAATGPTGALYEIKPDGSNSPLYKSEEDNITSLVSDGGDLLYVGTDPDGRVVRINRKTKESFVVYNASESEISALALDKAGNLYAATGESALQPQPSNPEASKEKAGRPEASTGAKPIPPGTPPSAPKPPELPNPNPGEPAPIPKKTPAKKISWSAPSGRSSRPLLLDNSGDDAPDEPGPGGPGPGQPNAPASTAEAQPENANAPFPNGANPGPGEAKPEGNAIYKIDKDGFVTEVFRQPVVIFSMLEQNGVLLVGTGGDGDIYQVNPEAEETVVLAKVDPKQVMCLLPGRDGKIYLGMANTGGVAAMTSGYAGDGTYTSTVLDATQVSRFGKMQLHGSLPEGSTLTIATRSGNVKEADVDGWSKWSDETPATEFLAVKAPTARFLQYRLTFTSKDGTRTPVVDDVDVAYQIPNMAPVVKSIKLTGVAEANAPGPQAPAMPGMKPGGEQANKPPGGTGVQQVVWEASDPNNDTLTYSLYFRLRGGPWILLKDKLTDTNYLWDTRSVADGRYEVKVIASDAASNPAATGKTGNRVSDPIMVDNTPPVIGDLKSQIAGDKVTIDCRIVDQTGTVANCEYSVDSNDDWKAVLPSDNIYDEPSESVEFSIPGLSPGTHQVTLRATDNHGNQGFQSLTVKLESPKKD